MQIDAAGCSDVGRKREENEDSFFLDKELGFFGVADGMGGHQAGEVASKKAADAVQDALRRFVQNGEQHGLRDDTLTEEALILAASFREANKAVFQKAKTSETKRGMGTTLSVVFFTGMTLAICNVGDSPIYLIRKGKVELLSQTHTVEAELALLQPQHPNAGAGRYHHMLTRAVGIQEEVEPSLAEVQAFDGDKVVICSDGLSNKLDPDEIAEIVTKHPPQEACATMVDMANERGGEDNITVVVLSFSKHLKPAGKVLGLFSKLVGR